MSSLAHRGWRAGCECKPRDRRVRRPVERLVMCQLEFVPAEIKCAMEYTENFYAATGRDQVGDSVMAVEQYPDVS